MRQRIFAPRFVEAAQDEKREFKTPNMASRRLLEAIRAIENDFIEYPSEYDESESEYSSSEDSEPITPHTANNVGFSQFRSLWSTPSISQHKKQSGITRNKILEELAHLKQYIDLLDEEYVAMKGE